MHKIVFITVPTPIERDQNQLEFLSNPELDDLLNEGWQVLKTENVTPPKAVIRSVIQVVLRK